MSTFEFLATTIRILSCSAHTHTQHTLTCTWRMHSHMYILGEFRLTTRHFVRVQNKNLKILRTLQSSLGLLSARESPVGLLTAAREFFFWAYFAAASKFGAEALCNIIKIFILFLTNR